MLIHMCNARIDTFCSPAGDEGEKEEMEKAEKEYVVLCDYLKRQLGDKVAQVKISNRISTSPCVLVTSKFGWSANMEK